MLRKIGAFVEYFVLMTVIGFLTFLGINIGIRAADWCDGKYEDSKKKKKQLKYSSVEREEEK